jgi:hypothetical protein
MLTSMIRAAKDSEQKNTKEWGAGLLFSAKQTINPPERKWGLSLECTQSTKR